MNTLISECNTISKKPYNPIFRVNYFLSKITLYRDRYKSRKALARLPVERLNDIGLDKEQAITESKKPFWK